MKTGRSDRLPIISFSSNSSLLKLAIKRSIRSPGQGLASSSAIVELLSQLGGVLYDLREFDEAIGCYKRALALAPTSPALHHAIGRARFLQGRFEGSRAAFARAIELEPDNAEHYAKIGRTFESEGRFDEAIVWQEKALSHQSDPRRGPLQPGNAMFAEFERDKRA
jgi:tetratricopeptide (TPR) repeat protein